jgi:hypothetical protein
MPKNLVFPCEKCGNCCRNLSNSPLYKELDTGYGICRYFDESTNECTIYENRPLICRVDEFYEKNLKSVISKEKYYEKNKIACRKLQNKARKQRGE